MEDIYKIRKDAYLRCLGSRQSPIANDEEITTDVYQTYKEHLLELVNAMRGKNERVAMIESEICGVLGAILGVEVDEAEVITALDSGEEPVLE